MESGADKHDLGRLLLNLTQEFRRLVIEHPQQSGDTTEFEPSHWREPGRAALGAGIPGNSGDTIT